MRKMQLSFTQPTITINGVEFKVMRSDAAIIQDLLDIDAGYVGKNMSEPENILAKNAEVLKYLDKLLGIPDAAKAIVATIPGMEGFDLGLAGTGALFSEISLMASDAYAAAIKAKYEDD